MIKDEIKETHSYYQTQNGANGEIGTLSEKTLHAYLKRYYEPDSDNQEIKIGRYYADILNETGIIEIQTQNFNLLRNKLSVFLKDYDVTVVYPIAQIKKLCWINEETGEVSVPRKSPKTGSPYDAFRELYKIRLQLNEPNLHFRLIFLDLTEYRYLNGWSRDKKKGSSRCERIPNSVLSEIRIDKPEDFKQLIPPTLCGKFGSADFAREAKIRKNTAQTALNILNFVGVVKRVGKNGNAFIYEICK